MASTKATKAITIEADSKSATTREDGAVITEASDLQSSNETTEINQPLFQAVGIIRGEVKFSDEGKITVTLSKFEYGIECNKKHSDALSGLKKEMISTGESIQRLIVYPKVMHFPSKDQPQRVWFQLVGFVKEGCEMGIATELADNQFKLCGLWQFIPVCRPPCISIFLNFTTERLELLKATDDPATDAKFMKTNHVPVLWKDSPVRPFRFNPKANKEDQGHPYFVQIKAAFLPHRDAFGFVEQLEEPIEQAPKFMKLPKAQGRKNLSPKSKKKPGQKAASQCNSL